MSSKNMNLSPTQTSNTLMVSFAPCSEEKDNSESGRFLRNKGAPLSDDSVKASSLCAQMASLACRPVTATPVLVAFTRFPELAIELRLKIWILSLEHRILKIDPVTLSRLQVRRHSWDDIFDAFMNVRLPSLFRVRQESRRVGQEVFQIVNRSLSFSLRPTYFLPTLDILHLNRLDIAFLKAYLPPVKSDTCLRSNFTRNTQTLAVGIGEFWEELDWFDEEE
jgi:hypothetical protein